MFINTSDFLEQCGGSAGKGEAERYSPLGLAYIGDAVFELLVRSRFMSQGNLPVKELNKKSASTVNASSQALMYHKLSDKLTDNELAVLRRGRNAKSFSRAKNSSVSDYRHSTGLEALFGYLYIKGEISRITELFEICMEQL